MGYSICVTYFQILPDGMAPAVHFLGPMSQMINFRVIMVWFENYLLIDFSGIHVDTW